MSATSNGDKKRREIHPTVPLALLQSAFGYFRDAGLSIVLEQHGNELIIKLDAVRMIQDDSGKVSFEFANVVTPVASVVNGVAP